MIKTKIRSGINNMTEKMLKKSRRSIKKSRINTLDGIKVYGKGLWLHIRPSNTEPVIRVIAEGRDKKEVRKLVDSLIG
jgi:phosphomannomutase